MHKYVIKWLEGMRVLTIFIALAGGFFMKDVSNAGEEQLNQRLAAISSQNKGVGDWGKLEAECLNLLKEYESPEDKGKIYAAIALTYSKSGYSSREDIRIPKSIKYCKKALQYPLEVTTACEMYGRWTGALMVKYWDSEKEEFVKRRQEAIVPCLTGLKLALDNKAPKKRQPPPAVGIYHISPSSPHYQKVMKKYKEELAARKKWEFENKLYNSRRALTQSCVSLYSHEPYDTDELEQLASEILKDDEAIREILAEVRSKISPKR